eukprot:TRINITY_DN5441_c0_g1_i2.p1 TRINITY_DN5441_c0_g1~~TRINITY_DN5441_c0_g1_i2.p1  ORF type:complete len:147 (+),score=35.47 TRINITY_DN5441_c0_g1_i2:48-488(+)
MESIVRARRVTVFGASSIPRDSAYIDAARDLGSALATRGDVLVYGGERTGVLGSVCQAMQKDGGKVISIMPKSIIPPSIQDLEKERFVAVDTMHERKALLSMYSDVSIALPGGFGTLDELFEFTTWQQLSIHNKAIGILNLNGDWI